MKFSWAIVYIFAIFLLCNFLCDTATAEDMCPDKAVYIGWVELQVACGPDYFIRHGGGLLSVPGGPYDGWLYGLGSNGSPYETLETANDCRSHYACNLTLYRYQNDEWVSYYDRCWSTVCGHREYPEFTGNRWHSMEPPELKYPVLESLEQLANDGTCKPDLCPDDQNKIEPGQCGCGAPDTDSNNDGIADCILPLSLGPPSCSE